MEIEFTGRISYTEFQVIAVSNFTKSIDTSIDKVVFLLKNVERIYLPQILSLLVWSSTLVDENKKVIWVLSSHRIWANREAIELMGALETYMSRDEFNTFNARVRGFRSTVLRGQYPNMKTRWGRFKELRQEIIARNRTAEFWLNRYFDILLKEIRGYDVNGFLKRWDILKWAVRIGVKFDPTLEGLFYTPLSRSDEFTHALEVQCITLPDAIKKMVQRLSNPEELRTIFEKHNVLDLISSGAFSEIILREIAVNIEEHAGGNYGFLATRLLRINDVVEMTKQQIGQIFFNNLVSTQTEALEIVIADDGNGVYENLEPKLHEDGRKKIKQKFIVNQKTNRFNESDVINYAFDRLSSSKRNFAQLIHFILHEHGEKDDYMSSGLYWVWNTVRIYGGLLIIRTNETIGWFDFQESPDGLFRYDKEPYPLSGTQIIVCLPLMEKQQISLRLPEKMDRCEQTIPEIRVRRLRNLEPSHCRTISEKMEEFLRILESEYYSFGKSGIFVIDLSGIRNVWFVDKKLISILIHFFIELNFYSTTQGSAIVLWNVPRGKKALIENALRDEITKVCQKYQQVEQIRPTALIIWEDDKIEPVPKTDLSVDIFGTLFNQPSISFDDLCPKYANSEIKNKIAAFISQNRHLIQQDMYMCNLLICKESLENEVEKEIEHDVKILTEKTIDEGGILVDGEKDGYWFRLPSGLYTQKFYQFSTVLSNIEWCIRIGWWFRKKIQYLIKENGLSNITTLVITVTRSTLPLIEELTKWFNNERVLSSSIKFLSTLTPEEMREKIYKLDNYLEANVIIITDVISSGRMVCNLIEAASKRKLELLGIVTILDIRTKQDKLKNLFDRKLTVLTMRQFEISKVDYSPGPIVNIDKINICPVEPQDKLQYPTLIKQDNMWKCLQNPGVLQVGHFTVRDYHHYIYFIDASVFLNTKLNTNNIEINDVITDYICIDFLKKSELSQNDVENSAFILYTDPQVSKCKPLVRSLQDKLGILFSHPLYRTRESGTWKFTPFTRLGMNIRNKCVLLIDDGTCSGKTLMALIEAAIFCEAKKIIGYFLIDRMETLSAAYFKDAHSIQAWSKAIDINFLFPIGIPVFDSNTCPLCQYQRDLELIQREYNIPRLSTFCEERRSFLDAQNVDDQIKLQNFPWPITEAHSIAKYRQALELEAFYKTEEDFLSSHVEVFNGWLDKTPIEVLEKIPSGIIELAFIIATEPNVMEKPWFNANAKLLLKVMTRICDLELIDGKSICTVLEGIFRIMVFLARYFPGDTPYSSVKLWKIALEAEKKGHPGIELLIFLIAREFSHMSSSDRISSVSQLCQELLRQGDECYQHFISQIKKTQTKLFINNAGLILLRQFMLYPKMSWLRMTSRETSFMQLAIALYENFSYHRRRQNDIIVIDKILTKLRFINTADEMALTEMQREVEKIIHVFLDLDILNKIHTIGEKYNQDELIVPSGLLLRLYELEDIFWSIENFLVDRIKINDKKIEEMSKKLESIWPSTSEELEQIVTYCFSEINKDLTNAHESWRVLVPDREWRADVRCNLDKNLDNVVVIAPPSFIEKFILDALDNLKYAFPCGNGDNNKVVIESRKYSNSEVIIKVIDNGIGPKESIEPNELGRNNSFANEFGGRIILPKRTINNETEVSLILKILPKI
jgi:hypoxanthine-guanine phosphoribosyltransferase